MSETIADFLKFNKVMCVKLINNIATDLKVGLTISNFSGDAKEYQSSIKNLPDFAYIGQYTYQNRGIMCSIDPKIITLTTQRCFGGQVDIKRYKNSTFTFSETFIGKSILNQIEAYFKKKKCKVTLNRIEHQKNRSHLFFSDEKVMFIETNCMVNETDVGKIYFIYPLSFVKQENPPAVSP